jgi:hypothetical protein
MHQLSGGQGQLQIGNYSRINESFTTLIYFFNKNRPVGQHFSTNRYNIMTSAIELCFASNEAIGQTQTGL